MLPLSRGYAESHGFEYRRNGTLSMFAACNTATREVLRKTAARHTSEQFLAFLIDVIANQPRRWELHVICDNVNSRKTQRGADLFDARRNVRPRFTSTYSPWLKLVLAHLARCDRPPGMFSSVKDLDRRLMHYLHEHNKHPKPIKWKYDDPSHRIRPVTIQ